MSSNNMDASCHTTLTLYRVKWPWLDISCSRDQDQTNVASVGVLGICGRVGGSCMVLNRPYIISHTTRPAHYSPLLFTIFAFGLVEEEERQQRTSHWGHSITQLCPVCFLNIYATSDLAKSYATLAHFSWFMLTYYNNPVLIGFHKTWNVEANRILLTILNRKAADVSRWVLSFLRP